MAVGNRKQIVETVPDQLAVKSVQTKIKNQKKKLVNCGFAEHARRTGQRASNNYYIGLEKMIKNPL